jgi:hypothetical protein
MLHLPTERLAALGDDVPTPEEEAHLESCAVCTRERGAYEALVAMAHEDREPFGLPLTRWDSIAAAMSLEEAPAVETHRRTWRPTQGLLRIAAGLLLVAGGAMAGRLSAGARALPESRPSLATISSPLNEAALAADSSSFGSVQEARDAQQRSELLYQQAASFLARQDTTGTAVSSPAPLRSRLAALDQVISTTREAMRQAPHDPVINGYYLTTLGQREATLRQLNSALPASIRVNSF